MPKRGGIRPGPDRGARSSCCSTSRRRVAATAVGHADPTRRGRERQRFGHHLRRPAAPGRPAGSGTLTGPVVNTRFGPGPGRDHRERRHGDGRHGPPAARAATAARRASPAGPSRCCAARPSRRRAPSIDGVSGATYTSVAYARSLQAALDERRALGRGRTGAAGGRPAPAPRGARHGHHRVHRRPRAVRRRGRARGRHRLVPRRRRPLLPVPRGQRGHAGRRRRARARRRRAGRAGDVHPRRRPARQDRRATSTRARTAPDGRPDPTGVVKGWAVDEALVDPAPRRAPATSRWWRAGTWSRPGEPEPGRPWRIGIRHPDARRPGRGVLARPRPRRGDLRASTSAAGTSVDPHTGLVAGGPPQPDRDRAALAIADAYRDRGLRDGGARGSPGSAARPGFGAVGHHGRRPGRLDAARRRPAARPDPEPALDADAAAPPLTTRLSRRVSGSARWTRAQ